MAPVTEAWAVSWSPDIRGGRDFDKESFSRQLISKMPLDGCRLADVVERIGFSEQAVSEIAVEAEQQGYIQIVPDGRDARAKHLGHTTLGLQLVKHALELGHEAEADIPRMIGGRKMRQFKEILRPKREVVVQSRFASDSRRSGSPPQRLRE